MATLLRLALSNFTITFFLLGLISAGVAVARSPGPRTRCFVVDRVLAHFLLFTIGLLYLYNFVMHTVFASMTARFIGWPDSPFQLEVGFASLGYSIAGFLAFRGSFEVKKVAVFATSAFLLGAAGGHVYQMITHHNFAPGNAGSVFYGDVLLPAIGMMLLYLRKRCE